MNDNLTLTGATIKTSWGGSFNLKTYDDGFGDLYVYGQEFGPTLLIRADSESSAYEIAIDESPTIDEEDIHEAYGLYITSQDDEHWVCSDHGGVGTPTDIPHCVGKRNVIGVFDNKDDAIKCSHDSIVKYELGLIEGYQYQSNGSGTGIVNTGNYEWLTTLESFNNSHDDQIIPVWTDH